MAEFSLGALRGARVSHIFKDERTRSLCGTVWTALVWNWFPGNSMDESECSRCLERYKSYKAGEVVGEVLAAALEERPR